MSSNLNIRPLLLLVFCKPLEEDEDEPLSSPEAEGLEDPGKLLDGRLVLAKVPGGRCGGLVGLEVVGLNMD